MILHNCFQTKPGTRRESSKPSKWTPPPQGKILVNVDAALFPDHWRMSAGPVFHDHNGECILAMSEPLVGFTTLELAKALALRQAVAVAQEKGHVKVTFTSDCLSLIQRVNSSNPDRSSAGSVIVDIKKMVVSFSSVTFKHVFLRVKADILNSRVYKKV
jgi:hypothetical protein